MNTFLKCVILTTSVILLGSQVASAQSKTKDKDIVIEVAVTCGDGFLYVATENGQYALLDTNHQQLTPFVYSNVDILHDEMLVARRNGRKALINCSGQQITSDDIVDFKIFYGDKLKHRYFVINEYGKMGVIDDQGTILVPVLYDRIDPVSAHEYLYAQAEGVKHYYKYNGKQMNQDKLSTYVENKDL